MPQARADNWFAGADEYAATAKTVDGRVSVLRDLREWALEVNDKVKVQQTIVTGKDGRALFQVSDGSTFQVFPNSKVVFRKNAGNWRDLLDVMLGRVRVQIEHIGDKPNPNRILTPTAVISVRGTIFDITVNDENESTLVEVEEGTVDVAHALLGSKNIRTLHAGDSIRVYRDEPIARKMDKGSILRAVIRAASEAGSIASGTGTGGVGGRGGVGGGPVGDSDPGSTTPAPPGGPLPAPPPPTGGLPSIP
ncbi:MAG: FecR family protein [Acidobacteriota bacterium]